MKKNKQQIVILDCLNGCWEINRLDLPLVHKYHGGFLTIKVLKEYDLSKPFTKKDREEMLLDVGKWYDHIWFGLKLLFGPIVYKFSAGLQR